MNKKNINYIILFIIFSIFFIYSYFAVFNKKDFTKAFQSNYIFTIGIFRDKSVSITNIAEVKSSTQLNSPYSEICTDHIVPTFFYEPIYFSDFDGKPFKQYVQLKITQSETFPIFFSVYKKDVDFDQNALKSHIQKTLAPYLDTSASCLGKMSIEFFERVD